MLVYLYKALGEDDRMIHHFNMTTTLEPLFLPAKVYLAKAYLSNHNHTKSLHILDQTIYFDLMFRLTFKCKTLNNFEINNLNNAFNYAAKYVEIPNNIEYGIGFLGFLYALKGDHIRVEENLVGLRKRAEKFPEQDLSIVFAFVYSVVGVFDSTIRYLNKTIHKKLGAIIFLGTFVPLHPLSKDQRFQLLRDRIYLPSFNLPAP